MSNRHADEIRISAKNLGQLLLRDYCPRCLYIKLRLGNTLPWSIFPGIFSSIDSYSTKITWQYFEKYGKLPKWFAPFGQCIMPIKVPHHSKFSIIDEVSNVRLTGVPDDIFFMRNGK